jgi:hypothetical protein
MSNSRKAIVANTEYRWVLMSKVLDFNSPRLWHSHFIETANKESHQTSRGVKLIRELENLIVIIEAAPIVSDPDYWNYRGWVLEMPSDKRSDDYSEIALQCEVKTASEPPVFTETYLIGSNGLPSEKIEKAFTDEATDQEYAFGILLESHSRATYLKYLLQGVESTVEGFRLEMVREDTKIITAFGEAYNGKWSLMITEDPINNVYDAEFTFWRSGSYSSNRIRENNPTIASEESQYFIGTLIKEPRIKHLANCLQESLSRYE